MPFPCFCFPGRRNRAYFTQFTVEKGLFYCATTIFAVSMGVVVIIQPFMKLPCLYAPSHRREFSNPGFLDDVCLQTRFPELFWLTPEECDFGRRILASIVMGGVIGWERRHADRAAGIRTMSLVSLGSCLFAITSAHAFISGPMEWDGSRVAAAIPSGVGFLGAGLIWKQDQRAQDGSKVQSVHGLTTAASIWLSAAVGIALGGAMYVVSVFTVSIMVLLLRFGPRISDDIDSTKHEESASDVGDLEMASPPNEKTSINYIHHQKLKRGDSGFYGAARLV